MRNSLVLAAAGAFALLAQGPDIPLDPHSSFVVRFPADAPVALLSADWGASKATARGGALQVDLHSTLLVRNTGTRRLRGVTLLVLAQEVTPGGKASVTLPSLDIEPGESFPVRIDLRLMRPLAAPGGTLVEVGLDGLLFDDLQFFGPNRLNSRRVMTALELEARRDRRALLSALEAGGAGALRGELLGLVSRLSEQPRLEMQMLRAGRATNTEPSQALQFTFLKLPGAPVELLSGYAVVGGNEARAPRIEVANRVNRPIRHVEVGWLLKDPSGATFQAGTVPADIALAPGQRSEIIKDGALRFSRPGGAPVAIKSMTGFLNSVEFSDGEVWVPARAGLAQSGLTRVLAPSAEEQRLAELYRRKGLDAVVEQLKKLR